MFDNATTRSFRYGNLHKYTGKDEGKSQRVSICQGVGEGFMMVELDGIYGAGSLPFHGTLTNIKR